MHSAIKMDENNSGALQMGRRNIRLTVSRMSGSNNVGRER